jgi:hypothetical protein
LALYWLGCGPNLLRLEIEGPAIVKDAIKDAIKDAMKKLP